MVERLPLYLFPTGIKFHNLIGVTDNPLIMIIDNCDEPVEFVVTTVH